MKDVTEDAKLKWPIGFQAGRLTVIGHHGRIGKRTYLICRCECGRSVRMRADALTRNESCGCSRVKHMKSHSPEFRSWAHMLERCYNPKDKSYARYGGRGITVCERWRDSSAQFIADMGPKPSASHSLDRRDNNGNYEPDNCRWATRAEQNRNYGRNVNLTVGDETLCVADWAKRLGIGRSTIEFRLKAGWPTERALFTPVRSCVGQ